MDHGEEQLLRHLLDLCRRAERTGQPQFSGFCSPAEQDDFLRMPETARLSCCFRGGYEGAERRVLVAGTDEMEENDAALPLSVLRVFPASVKFAEELSHRDYLGAILGLGIERSLIGDILVRDGEAWVFCLDAIRDYLTDALTQVRRTTVRAEAVTLDHPELRPRLVPLTLNIASERLDGIVAAFAKCSRSQVAPLFAAGKVFVNSRPAMDKSLHLKEGDIVSVRGVGKARYEGILRETRKGRLAVQLMQYQ